MMEPAKETPMDVRRSVRYGFVLIFVLAAIWSVRPPGTEAFASPPQANRAEPQVMPQYNKSGALMLPSDYRRWVMVGSSLDLNYSETPAQGGHQMFMHTLMEPTAHKTFVETGKFREGTMFALLLQGVADKVMPARQGQFAGDVHGVEMAVKDKAHSPDGWSYYGFGGMGGSPSTTATAQPKNNCYSCHVEHAQRDNVFLQFYPLLAEAAGLKK
jgi:Cytochrome P460